MTFQVSNLNELWGKLIIEELIRNGIDYFCISPGSRSTPLTVATARHKMAKTRIIYDERGAAFHALGYGRAAQKPAVLICTSGTAAANYFPAVIEASLENIPMIIISADRPPELRQSGANQAIQQPGLFGNYTKWNFDLPCPTREISPEVILTTVDQMIYQARKTPGGPVHLNAMFREPLAPQEDTVEYKSPEITKWLGNEQAYTFYHGRQLVPGSRTIQQVTYLLNSAKQGIIAVGRLSSDLEKKAVKRISQKLGWPVFADVTSGLRLDNTPQIIHYFDQLLLSKPFAKSLFPDTILHLGGRFVSKRWLQFLAQTPPENYIVVQPSANRYDPGHKVTNRLQSNIDDFCEAIDPLLIKKKASQWLTRFQTASKIVQNAVITFCESPGRLNEISIAYAISRHIKRDTALFLAASMPIRDMDMYAFPETIVNVDANRGASGIDGTISSAAGYAIGSEKATTLVTGDLAFLHDLNSLSILSSLESPVFIVLINNQGGGIFSFLPIAKTKDVFESYFGTPHTFTFQEAAKLFGLLYFSPKTLQEFIQIYKSCQQQHQSVIIEIKTERGENVLLHQNLQKQIIQQLTGR